MKTVAGKVALISGGVSGIGLGIAKVFAEAGMRIALGYRREAHLAEVMAWFAMQPGYAVHPIRLEVTDRASWARAVAEIEDVFGKLHVLVNNAGITFAGRVDQATHDDWEWIMRVNFGGVVNGLSACLPRIRAQGDGGHIINVSSMAAYLPSAEVGLYSTSKFAVRGLTEALRPALAAEGIGVSELAPGLTRSNIHHAAEGRPAEFGDTALTPDPEFIRQFGAVMDLGMDPLEVGRKALAGMRANRPLIFTHPESRDELREAFDTILAAFPDEPVPPERLALEQRRRATKAGGGSILK